MQYGKTASALSLSALLFAPLVGCGGSASKIPDLNSQGPAGRVTQGPVSGATVWADGLGTGISFVIDSAEQGTKTTTSSNGSYTIPVSPSYKYVLISQGGTDTLTGKTSATLLAPGGAISISPLTTLITLDTSGTLLNSLTALLPAGKTFDSGLTASAGLTPAAMVLITSITTTVTAIEAAIQEAASKSGATLSAQQMNNISLVLFSQMASGLATVPAASLANTAGLSTNLQTSLCGAVAAITASNSNITGLTCAIATTIANDSVAVAANVVGNATGVASLKAVTASNVQTSPGVAVSTTTVVTESTVLSTSNTQLVNNTITAVATTTATSITVASTPTTYSPPAVAIINNPTVIGYSLVAVESGTEWSVRQFTITFSDDMVATEAGSSSYAHSVLNPANYQFTQSGCSPSSYAANVVSMTCGSLSTGTFGVTITKSSSSAGVWASTTSLGLPVNNVKTFNLTAATGSTSVNLF